MERALDARLARTHVAFPATITEIAAGNARVSVRPSVDFVVRDVEGQPVHEEAPVIHGVPLCWPRTPRAGLLFPVEVGDPVLVVVADRPIGDWLARGSTSTSDAGSHCLDGAIAIPCLMPDELEHTSDHPMLGYFTGQRDGVHVRPGEVRLGDDSASNFVALANKFEAVIEGFLGAVPVLNDGGAALQAGMQAAWTAQGGSVAAEKVKAK